MNKSALLLAIVGQTASGKSALALEAAKRYNGEIICADSRTIYKGMDIGTAKPTPKEQQMVRHHLLDIALPGEHFSAAQFKAHTHKKIEEITARGHLPIVVGGTGLYVDAILFDYQFVVKNPTDVQRKKLEDLSVPEIQDLLRQKSIPFPENEKNKRFLVRSLERGSAYPEDRKKLRPNTLVLGTLISKRQLRSRIEKRVEKMFRQGLRKEVDELVIQYGWGNEALTGIGYREFRPYYDGDISIGAVKQCIVQDTLQFAKRQKTWFKRNSHIQWIEEVEDAFDKIDAFINSNQYNER